MVRLVCDRARDRLPDPPGCVRREFALRRRQIVSLRLEDARGPPALQRFNWIAPSTARCAPDEATAGFSGCQHQCMSAEPGFFDKLWNKGIDIWAGIITSTVSAAIIAVIATAAWRFKLWLDLKNDEAKQRQHHRINQELEALEHETAEVARVTRLQGRTQTAVASKCRFCVHQKRKENSELGVIFLPETYTDPNT
jgi:hypothetical protein